MKAFIVFGFCVVIACARVSEDTEEQHHLELYRRYCLSGSSSSGKDGDLEWHCKIAQEPVTTKIIEHELNLPTKNTNQTLIVFIEIPYDDYHNRDNMLDTGHEYNNQNTKIVLVPEELYPLIGQAPNLSCLANPYLWLAPSLALFTLILY